jgi:hypothetical protein
LDRVSLEAVEKHMWMVHYAKNEKKNPFNVSSKEFIG